MHENVFKDQELSLFLPSNGSWIFRLVLKSREKAMEDLVYTIGDGEKTHLCF